MHVGMDTKWADLRVGDGPTLQLLGRERAMLQPSRNSFAGLLHRPRLQLGIQVRAQFPILRALPVKLLAQVLNFPLEAL